MGWTKEQQKVIDLRNKNILVSAAAGSGKTAVLVERIITMITEGDEPTDIDRLLVVTFTNAAAAEMKTRIGNAIEEKLQNEPDNLHLQKQIALLPTAHITTIHSFCLNVIRNYFMRIDLDPSFKVGDEAEITLLKSDVLAEILEEYYEEGREDFHSFIESYSHTKSDAPIEEMILQLYSFSMSNPWPKQWIAEMKNSFNIETIEDMNKTQWMKELMDYIKSVIADLLYKNSLAIDICNQEGGPGAYLTALLSDRDTLTKLKAVASYEEYYNYFNNISFARLSNKREEGVLADKKDQVKGIREEIKKAIKDLSKQFFFQSPDEMVADLQAVRSDMLVLFELTESYMEAFAKKKEDKNIIDFNDIEHFALKILVEHNGETVVPTEAAIELRKQFDEILIDEYQDSNLVQETILKSVSKEDEGYPNRFMVGDVKQSIYKFRLAMPELFIEKYNNYSLMDKLEDGEVNCYQRIDLDRNFRSRAVVLDCVNYIFEQIMHKSVGDIDYDQEAALKCGATFKETNLSIAEDAELILVTEEGDLEESQRDEDEAERNEEEDISNLLHSEDFDEEVFSKKELEARAIAKRIKELVDPESGIYVQKKDEVSKTIEYKRASYKDIVILLRSMSSWSDIFVNTLMQEGIPAYADTSSGYFKTLEVNTVLNMLKIIDNPRQDIPLAGVLYSPMIGLSSAQLAIIRAFRRNCSMYMALISFGEDGEDENLKGKVNLFLQVLDEFRSKVNYTPIHELIEEVLDKTGYYHYVSAMPGGDRRKANLDMLISHAIRFEKGTYSGLFHFIRYIEKLHKYEVDYGEAASNGEADDTVRIMSIHKSKGLQFPIVIVAGLSKQFNTQDLRSKIVLHAKYGVGPEYIDNKLRTKVPTLIKKVIQKKAQIENLGEELRVLYVALTRAQEKLIMTGYLKDTKQIQKKDFSFFDIVSAKSYMDWVLPAVLNHCDNMTDFNNLTAWYNKEETSTMVEEDIIGKSQGMTVYLWNKAKFLNEEIGKQIFIQKDMEELIAIDPNIVYNQEMRDEIKERLQYTYPYKKAEGLPVKMTVTELKRVSQLVDDELSENLYETTAESMTEIPADTTTKSTTSSTTEGTTKRDTELATDKSIEAPAVASMEATIPNFMKEDVVKTSTDRGTLYHKILELIDLSEVKSSADLTREIDSLISSGRIDREDLKVINLYYIKRFINSDIANRMRKAKDMGRLFKEKQFVIGVKANEIKETYPEDEFVLIQGIIDAFFEEDGDLVLVDYKSDFVAHEEQLIKRYQVQLNYYQKALEQITSKKVKEKIIYSLVLGREIRID
ncbi:MAG: helicase-exonuclease AddAB subunit AddA [Clostridiales bacterium]|nr:helicase-exonuclease AddAB subunit AddA [Clostridiales bacterium]